MFSAFGLDTREKPFASGGAALPSGRKLLFGEAIRLKCELARRRSQEKMKQCFAPDTCIGAGCKIAQTLPIFALAKGPLGITLVVAQLAINRVSDNVASVKHFLSVLTRALRRARHFALVEGSAIPTKARS